MHKAKLTIEKSSIKLIFLLLLFKCILDLAYVYAVSPIYAYSGFTILINPITVFESYLLVIFIGLYISPNINRASHFFIWMLVVGSLIPSLSYYAMHSGNRTYMYSMLLSFLCVVVVSKLPIVKIGTLKEGRTIGVAVLIAMVGVVTVSLIAKGGLSHFNLDFSQVYNQRQVVEGLINVGVWAYVNTWVFKVINPALIALALWRKRYRLVVVFTILQVLFFAISSHKSVMFYPVLILVVYLIIRQKRAFERLTWGLISVVIISSCIFLFFDNIWPLSLFVRRSIFVPAQLNFAYYDLFSNIGHVYLSNSILSQYISYPFEYRYTNMVSMYLLGHPNTSCNNGFLATSYMHFGYLGMLVFSIIVGLLLWLADILVNKRIPLWLGISILAVPFFSLFTSSDLFTALLTHGIIVGMMVLLIIGAKQDN